MCIFLDSNNAQEIKITAKNINKLYKSRDGWFTALEETSLDIIKGEIFCLLGPSGCGKSTLLNILSGFIKPTDGSVYIEGQKVIHPNPRYAMLDQEYGLYPWRTVFENIRFGLEIKRIPSHEQVKIVEELINLVKLQGFENHHPFELSGGMKQRVALARVLAVDPEIIFMDEPFNALDLIMRVGLQDELLGLWNCKNQTIVFVTHDIEEAIYLGDRIGIMKNQPGRIEKIIPINLDRPRDRMDVNFHLFKDKIFNEFVK